MTVKGKEWPCSARGYCLHCLAGRSRYRLADSPYAVLKSVKTKQTLHSVLLIEFSSSLPFKFFSSEWSYSFLSLFCQVWSLLGVRLQILQKLYYKLSMPTTVAFPLLDCSTEKSR